MFATTRSTPSLARIALAVLFIGAGTAHAQNASVPMPRPGLWQVKVTEDQVSDSYKECLDEATLKRALELQESMAKAMDCGLKSSKQGAGWVQTSNCKPGPNEPRQQSTRKITGDFNTSYRIEESASQKMADGKVIKATSKSEGKYLGACPADMEAGDRILANGQKINPFKMLQTAPAQ